MRKNAGEKFVISVCIFLGSPIKVQVSRNGIAGGATHDLLVLRMTIVSHGISIIHLKTMPYSSQACVVFETCNL